MTHKEYLQNSGLKQRAVAYRFDMCGIGRYSADADLSEDHLDMLTAKYGAQKQPRKVAQRAVSVPVYEKPTAQMFIEAAAQMTPQNTAQKAQTSAQSEPQKANRNIEKEILFWSSFAITAISILLTNSGLFVFADGFGILAGVMFGFSLVSAVVVARNSDKQETSEKALDVVLYLEIGACFLHVFTFHYALESKITLSDGWLLWIPSIVLSVCVAVMSYKGVELVRNYNVE